MGSAIGLREDFDGATLRRLSRTTKSANQARRSLALAEIYDGGSRGAAARIGGVGLQIVRDWVIRFNACGPDGLLDGKAPGPRSRLNDAQRQALVDVVGSGPIPAIHGVVRWRLIDLAQWLYDEFAVSLDETTISPELKKLGYVSDLATMPRTNMPWKHSKKGLRCRAGKGQRHPPEGHAHRDMVPGRGACGPEKHNHATLGQKRNAAIGIEGSMDEISLYLWCDLPGTGQRRRACPALLQYRYHVAASGRNIPCRRAGCPRGCADGPGWWHMTGKLDVPQNISIVALPAKCPELNPVENIWQLMRDNWLSNRVFPSYENIVDLCCEAWHKLVDQPWRIMTIGRRKWVRGS
jgi:transposase